MACVTPQGSTVPDRVCGNAVHEHVQLICIILKLRSAESRMLLPRTTSRPACAPSSSNGAREVYDRNQLRSSPPAPHRMRVAHVLWSGLEYVAGLSQEQQQARPLLSSTASSMAYDDIVNAMARISWS